MLGARTNLHDIRFIVKIFRHERHYKGTSQARSELLPDNSILKMRSKGEREDYSFIINY